MTKNSSDATPRELFIEELAQATGGACYTAPSSTTPGTSPTPNGPLTTMAIGEDGAPPPMGGPVLSTQAIGENGAPPIDLLPKVK